MSDKKVDNDLNWLDEAERHDLKNQLSLLQGYQELERLEEQTTMSPEVTQQRIKEAKEGIEEIYQQVRNPKEKFSFQDLISETYQELGDLRLPKKDKKVTINYHEEEPGATSEEEFHPAVQRMVYNLLENSLEHGDRDISIEVYADNEEIEMEVYDGGELDQDLIDEIFPDDIDKANPKASGSYIINRVAQDYNIDIDSPTGKDCYSVKMPKNNLEN